MMKRVYICAPLGGDIIGNLRRVTRYMEYALKCGTTPVVPHFYALCLDDTVPEEREMALAAGLSQLWVCDEMWVFGSEISPGMRRELQFCKNLNIPIRHVTEEEITEKIGEDISWKRSGNAFYSLLL